MNETTFLLEPLEGAVAGRHAVYRAAHLRGKRGTCRQPRAILEYDREPKIPAAMKLHRWVGTALLLLPQPGSCEGPGRMEVFGAPGQCPSPSRVPNRGGNRPSDPVPSAGASSHPTGSVMPAEPGVLSQQQAWVFQHASWKKSETQQNNIPELS